MLVNLQVNDFIEKLSSNEPVPGGGSVAALSGAIAAALAQMVANLTVGKKNYEEVTEEMKAVIEAVEAYKVDLTDLIDKDASSFDDVMKAFKLPKETDEEKAERTAAIQSGMKKAAEVPLLVAKKSLEVMDFSEKVVELGNKNAVTDGMVSAMMARAAVRGAILNVKINLGSIKDEDYVAKMTSEVNALEEKAMDLENRILAKVSL